METSVKTKQWFSKYVYMFLFPITGKKLENNEKQNIKNWPTNIKRISLGHV